MCGLCCVYVCGTWIRVCTCPEVRGQNWVSSSITLCYIAWRKDLSASRKLSSLSRLASSSELPGSTCSHPCKYRGCRHSQTCLVFCVEAKGSNSGPHAHWTHSQPLILFLNCTSFFPFQHLIFANEIKIFIFWVKCIPELIFLASTINGTIYLICFFV